MLLHGVCQPANGQSPGPTRPAQIAGSHASKCSDLKISSAVQPQNLLVSKQSVTTPAAKVETAMCAATKKLRIKSFCEGAFTLAEGLKNHLDRKTSDLDEAFDFVLATEFMSEEMWGEKFRFEADKLLELKAKVKAKWGVDARKESSYENVDVAILGAPYSNLGLQENTQILVRDMANALASAGVEWVILVGRNCHPERRNEKFPHKMGSTGLYKGLLHHANFQVKEIYVCEETKPLKVIEGYVHHFTSFTSNASNAKAEAAKEAKEDVPGDDARMFVALLRRNVAHNGHDEPEQVTPRCWDDKSKHVEEPLVRCLEKLKVLIKEELPVDALAAGFASILLESPRSAAIAREK